MTDNDNPEWTEADFAAAKTGSAIPAHIRAAFPTLESDAVAEAFVAEADLTEFDWSDMKPVRFEFANKDARK